jgi:hypothetical protein
MCTADVRYLFLCVRHLFSGGGAQLPPTGAAEVDGHNKQTNKQIKPGVSQVLGILT